MVKKKAANFDDDFDGEEEPDKSVVVDLQRSNFLPPIANHRN